MDEKIEEHEGSLVKKNKSYTVTEKMRSNPWILSTVVLGILVLIFLVGSFNGMTGKVVSEQKAGEAVINFVQAQTGSGELVSVENYDSNFYQVTINYQGQEIPLFTTKDGKNIVQGLTPLESEEEEEEIPQELSKSDKPVVELFVMTHCPYGTQAEKGILSVFELLGDKIDGKIRFVHYYMHTNAQEEVETPKQICIREGQPEKYLDYLKCFLGSEEGSVADSEACLAKVGIDKSKLNDCISSGRADEYYEEDSALSEQYGVRGSPTLVINKQQVSSGRDSASYLNIICSVFNDAPKECGEELSSASPSPGFGWEGTGSDTGAQC